MSNSINSSTLTDYTTQRNENFNGVFVIGGATTSPSLLSNYFNFSRNFLFFFQDAWDWKMYGKIPSIIYLHCLYSQIFIDKNTLSKYQRAMHSICPRIWPLWLQFGYLHGSREPKLAFISSKNLTTCCFCLSSVFENVKCTSFRVKCTAPYLLTKWMCLM